MVFPDVPFSETDTEWEPDQICDFSKIDDFENYLRLLGEFAKRMLNEKGINTKDDTIPVMTLNGQLRLCAKILLLPGQKKRCS